MKICSVFDTRPQFIKASCLSPAIRSYGIREITICTGQHYDHLMSEVFFDELQIPKPDYNLRVGSASHGAQTARMLEGIEEILLRERPTFVLVIGDTNSTLAGALAAAKLSIPIAHVEAGLRSNNRAMAEEINRVIVDRLSTILFCPTTRAVENLRREGIVAGVFNTGDPLFDVCLKSEEIARTKSSVLSRFDLVERQYFFLTLHRPQLVDDLNALELLLSQVEELKLPVIFAVHPRTRKQMSLLTLPLPKNLICTDPLGYFDALTLVKNAQVVITDSGGIQREAFFLKAPCVTVRTETEWPETVEAGWNVLHDSQTASLLRSVEAVSNLNRTDRTGFGTGDACKKIAEQLAGAMEVRE